MNHPAAAALGSSPLTRGKRVLDAEPDVVRGLIPAHAGKTCRSLTTRLPSGAHPRSRGENPRNTVACETMSGSSPLTRGKRPGLCNLD